MVMMMVMIVVKPKLMIYPSSAGLILFFLLCYRVLLLLVVSMPPSSFFFTRVYIFFAVRIMTQTEDRQKTDRRPGVIIKHNVYSVVELPSADQGASAAATAAAPPPASTPHQFDIFIHDYFVAENLTIQQQQKKQQQNYRQSAGRRILKQCIRSVLGVHWCVSVTVCLYIPTAAN